MSESEAMTTKQAVAKLHFDATVKSVHAGVTDRTWQVV